MTGENRFFPETSRQAPAEVERTFGIDMSDVLEVYTMIDAQPLPADHMPNYGRDDAGMFRAVQLTGGVYADL